MGILILVVALISVGVAATCKKPAVLLRLLLRGFVAAGVALLLPVAVSWAYNHVEYLMWAGRGYEFVHSGNFGSIGVAFPFFYWRFSRRMSSC
jgi:hypothetical protein